MQQLQETVCKFRCDSVKLTMGGQEVVLQAQYDQDLAEDRRFAKATPNGQLVAFISNPNVEGFFSPGRTYYLTLTPAD